MNRFSSQRGSAIIMLFVAVALFGMLAYAFMQGSRGSTSMITDEQAKLQVQQLIAYGNDVTSAVKRLKLRGCTSDKLDFGNGEWKRKNGTIIVAANTNAPADGSCSIFSTKGGSLAAKVFTSAGINTSLLNSAADYWVPGSGNITIQNMVGVGSSEPDLLLNTNLVSRQVCLAINKFANNYNSIPIDVGPDYFSSVPELQGKRLTCSQWSPSSWGEVYYVRQVLEVR